MTILYTALRTFLIFQFPGVAQPGYKLTGRHRHDDVLNAFNPISNSDYGGVIDSKSKRICSCRKWVHVLLLYDWPAVFLVKKNVPFPSPGARFLFSNRHSKFVSRLILLPFLKTIVWTGTTICTWITIIIFVKNKSVPERHKRPSPSLKKFWLSYIKFVCAYFRSFLFSPYDAYLIGKLHKELSQIVNFDKWIINQAQIIEIARSMTI